MILKENDPYNYFQESLESLRSSNYRSAMKSIDLAVINSTDKSFYMFQKIKILFVGKMFVECANYIEDNLISLYNNSSLYIFSQILYYYHVSSDCPTSYLKSLLVMNDIPSLLADKFEYFISKPNINLLEEIMHYKEIGNYNMCIDYCDLLLSKDIYNITIYLIKARCHCLLTQHDLGILTYRKAINLQPNLPSIYSELGNVMVELKHYPEAIHYFQKAFDLDPSSPELIIQLGEGYFLWKKYDSALINFKKVLIKKPNCIEALLRTANTYDQINRPKKARKYYNKVLKVKQG